MSTVRGDLIEDLVAGRWRDPVTGEPARVGTHRVVIERSLDGGEADLIGSLALGRRLAVVSDRNTFEALGRRIERALARVAAVDGIVLDRPKAEVGAAHALEERTRAADALVAVGSGTLNDLAKYVAHRTGRRYAVFATAPSMNGYLTATASLSRDRLRRALPAHPPAAALFDLEVLRHAPVRLIRAGIGDAICRTTAQTDWLLGHCLRDVPYSETPYLLQVDDEPCVVERTKAIVEGDVEGVRALTRLLVLSGLGMAIAGSSQPASMGEHLISHYVDTMAPSQPGSLHGEQVGVATLTISRLQHALLDAPAPPRVHPTLLDPAALRARYGAELAAQCMAELSAKALDGPGAKALNERLVEVWSTMTARLKRCMLPTERLQAALAAAGAPVSAVGLSLDPAFYRAAVRHAREFRRRYGILDLAGDAGRLDEFAAGEG